MISRKGYREERYKYALDLIDRMGEEAYTYICPLTGSLTERISFGLVIKMQRKARHILCKLLERDAFFDGQR
jgi:hypothetical protein